MHVVLVHPEIATNTGNIIRLCANAGFALHLVEPLGFSLDEPAVRRAGLDYHELADLSVHTSVDELRTTLTGRWFAFSSAGTKHYSEVDYRSDDVVVFGAERAGLPDSLLTSLDRDRVLTIPMMPGNRSLNLANAVAIVTYEAWRQTGFAGSAPRPGAAETSRGLTSETPAGCPFDT